MKHKLLHGGLLNNFLNLVFINAHVMYGTRVFLHFAPMQMRPPQPRFDHEASGLAAQSQSHYIYATTGGIDRVSQS